MDIWQQQEQEAKEAREARKARRAEKIAHETTDKGDSHSTVWGIPWWAIAVSGFIILDIGYAVLGAIDENSSIGLLLFVVGTLLFVVGVLSGMVITIQDSKLRKTPIQTIIITAIMLFWYFMFSKSGGLLGASAGLLSLPGLFMFFYSFYDTYRCISQYKASKK